MDTQNVYVCSDMQAGMRKTLSRVSGAVSLYHLQVPRVGTVLLMGDVHVDRGPGLCRNCAPPECLQVSEFVDLLGLEAQMAGGVVDVFYELPWRHPLLLYPRELLWSELQSAHGDQMYSARMADGKRVHYADIRFEPLLQHLHPFFFGAGQLPPHQTRWLAEALPSIEEYGRVLDVFVLSDDAPGALRGILQGSRVPVYEQVYTLVDEYSWAETVAGQRVHRIRKQLLKLPQRLRSAVLKMYAANREQLVSSGARSWSEGVAKFRRGEDLASSGVALVQLLGATLLMDVYLLCRLLHYITRQDCSGAVVVAGQAHIETYLRFFSESFPGAHVDVSLHPSGRPPWNRCSELTRKKKRGVTGGKERST
jgi:hypothetical protein